MPDLIFTTDDRDAAETLIRLALAEDLGDAGDLTSDALIPLEQTAAIDVVARQSGIVAGNPVAELVFAQLDPAVRWNAIRPDASPVRPGDVLATAEGPVRSLLKGERTVLNFLTQLSGVASLTRRYVDAVAGTAAAVLDTRKTWPGFRRLQKYAVRAGGGTNHRMGLYDGTMLKDNHLAAWTSSQREIAEAVRFVRNSIPEGISVEVEVDTLAQLNDALRGEPDIVLLDNMPPAELREAVAIRNRAAPKVLLEASGGVTLETVRAIAETGVDRISIGALTHSVMGLDIGFDWKSHGPNHAPKPPIRG
jgi:nicotinate-nucleotide pyrophosphorylase (carboxylating)